MRLQHSAGSDRDRDRIGKYMRLQHCLCHSCSQVQVLKHGSRELSAGARDDLSKMALVFRPVVVLNLTLRRKASLKPA